VLLIYYEASHSQGSRQVDCKCYMRSCYHIIPEKNANMIETKMQFIALLTAILYCFIHWKQQILCSTLAFRQGAI